MSIQEVKDNLDDLLANGVAKHVKVKWGKGHRYVIIIGGKRYQYKGGLKFNKKLISVILSLYIDMPDKSLKEKIIIDDIVAPDEESSDKYGLENRLSKPARRLRVKTSIKKIQQWVKENKYKFKQENHFVQIIYEITTINNDTGKVTTKPYNTPVMDVFGGNRTLRKAIERKTEDIKDLFENDYNLKLESIKILRIYIDDVKLNPQDIGDIKMFGTLLNLCGYDLNVGKYEYVNACCVEYHVNMFNKIRNNYWTIERFMKEMCMTNIDEGASLNQLIPLYKKYRIGYRIVDFKYHVSASHDEHDYKVNYHYPILFYMIEGNIYIQ